MTAQDRMNGARMLALAAALAIFSFSNPVIAQPQTAGIAVAGGIGAGERAHLSDNPVEGRNVKLVFALDTGNYVADVHVRVIAGDGEVVVDGVARGPWVYATLPAGRYTVTATYAGQTLTQQVTAVDHGRHLARFTWPVSAEAGVSTTTGIAPILGTGARRSVN